MRQTSRRRRAIGARAQMVLTCLAWAGGVLLAYFFWEYLNGGVHGLDSHAYWLTGQRTDMYAAAPGSIDAYLYSPAFAQVIQPLTLLSWPTFRVIWMILEAAAFGWLAQPLGWRYGVPLFLACTIEIAVGNVYAFLAVAVAVGLRYPAAWCLPLLTKITPCLGPVWFAARREWGRLGMVTAVSAAIVVLSTVLDAGPWAEWWHFLTSNSSGAQALLPLRFAVAVLVTVYAARTDRPAILVVAVLLANPMVSHALMSLTLLAAIPRIRVYNATPSRAALGHSVAAEPNGIRV